MKVGIIKSSNRVETGDIPPSEPLIRGTSSRLDKIDKDSGPDRMRRSSSYSCPSQNFISVNGLAITTPPTVTVECTVRRINRSGLTSTFGIGCASGWRGTGMFSPSSCRPSPVMGVMEKTCLDGAIVAVGYCSD